jgi:hypothetical protein
MVALECHAIIQMWLKHMQAPDETSPSTGSDGKRKADRLTHKTDGLPT